MAFGVCMNCLSSFPPSTGQKWKITSLRLFDQNQAHVYRLKHHIPPPPILVFLGLFVYRTPRGRFLRLTPCKIIILSNTRIRD